MPYFHPWPRDVGSSSIVRCFGGVKSKKCLHASLPVYLMVSLSLDDNHAMSLVFLLLISVRRRMDAECQLFLKHLFPANNSLCRCLVLAEGSPIASSLLTQNNNADECHLLVMFFFPLLCLKHCVSATEETVYAAIITYVSCSAAIGRGMHSSRLLTALLCDVLDGPGLVVDWTDST